MTRPIDISQLLKQKKQESKPRLLSKEERDAILRDRSLDDGEPIDGNDDEEEEMIAVQYKRRKYEEDAVYKDEMENTETLISESTKARIRAALEAQKQGDEHDVVDEYLGKHWKDKKLEELDDRDWRIFMEDFNISVTGKGVIHKPLRDWTETGILPSDMVTALVRGLRFLEPTPIQKAVIPNAVKLKNKKGDGRDILGVASTGSGKTLAFIIPILMKFTPRPINLKVLDGPLALILVPTRELAQQIAVETNKLLDQWGDKRQEISAVSIVGGHSLEDINNSLRDGCDILIATPGRLLDVISNHILVLNSVQTLVLDEADRMVDLGFEDQLRELLTHLSVSGTKQTMLFTATMSVAIQSIASGYLSNPLHITVGGAGSDSKPLITQRVRLAENEDRKLTCLLEDLKRYGTPAIVFINYKETVDWLANHLSRSRYKITTLHGSKSQAQREKAIQRMRSGEADIMIATNVAARGLDISNISLVVNFQMSKKFEDYVHRIGRTGRAGRAGTAVTYLTGEEDARLVKELYKYTKEMDPTKENSFSKDCMSTFKIKNNNDRILY
ncbi:Pre-mRNA-splicing ATP-dependent RNA helicase PRP28 [Nakaseomyces bracarensis]|uniref:RNA helicase n=1 Tax=Nakaseomyces bracarensis TaxID=273131 RepID=A0ABR4NU71_9SACH